MFFLLFFLANVLAFEFQGQQDLVTSLPGVDQMPAFPIYAGYLTINAETGKKFFYTFVQVRKEKKDSFCLFFFFFLLLFFLQAVNDTATTPLVRFLNGGPGCSSVGGGMFEEVGPLIPGENGNLRTNPYSWNQLANMLFIESPAGVGFSYSKTLSDYSSSDASTAQDNYDAMVQFLVKFPQFAGRPFFLTGEVCCLLFCSLFFFSFLSRSFFFFFKSKTFVFQSYAGHYIPERKKKKERKKGCVVVI